MDPNDRNSLRLGVRELHALLNKLESLHPKRSNPDRRFVRWDFRILRVDLTIEHATGSKVTIPVATRNISRGGISVLHSSFVYPDSRCHVSADLEDGHTLDVGGRITRCNHLGGKVHELGIKFDREVSTKDLLGLDPMNGAYSLECIDPKGLQGKVLAVCDAELDQQLLVKLLEETSLEISVSQDIDETLKRAQKGCDLILTSGFVGDGTAADILMALRSAGIDAPVIVMTSDDSDEFRDEIRMSGASGMIINPLMKQRLFQAMAEFLITDGSGGPLYSTIGDDDPVNEILMKFLGDLPRMILTLEKSLREADSDSCRSICRSLACSASPLGFASIGEIASHADRALSGGSGIRNAAADIRQLIIACRRIRSKPRAA